MGAAYARRPRCPSRVNNIALRAPAKLNLGLEIVGRRLDGYHDIVTIFQAVSRFDDLCLSPAAAVRLRVSDPALSGGDNLVVRALELLRERASVASGAEAHLEKTIPVAAGLGGASSDAAAALLAGQRLWRTTFSDAELAKLAGMLGADVPFFLRGGTALATGRGERLTPLPTPRPIQFIVVVPNLMIPQKTASLYRALTTADFSNGEAVRAQADALRAGRPLSAELLGNAFLRPLCALYPALIDISAEMTRAGAPFVALSGAGPSHYTAVADEAEAARIDRRLSDSLATVASVFTCSPVESGSAFSTAPAGTTRT